MGRRKTTHAMFLCQNPATPTTNAQMGTGLSANMREDGYAIVSLNGIGGFTSK
jgi:hypothetical protein